MKLGILCFYVGMAGSFVVLQGVQAFERATCQLKTPIKYVCIKGDAAQGHYWEEVHTPTGKNCLAGTPINIGPVGIPFNTHCNKQGGECCYDSNPCTTCVDTN